MIELPYDTRLELSHRIVDLYYAGQTLDEFREEVKAAFPDDPGIAFGYQIGVIVGRMEQQTKATNELYDLSIGIDEALKGVAKTLWGGDVIKWKGAHDDV